MRNCDWLAQLRAGPRAQACRHVPASQSHPSRTSECRDAFSSITCLSTSLNSPGKAKGEPRRIAPQRETTFDWTAHLFLSITHPLRRLQFPPFFIQSESFNRPFSRTTPSHLTWRLPLGSADAVPLAITSAALNHDHAIAILAILLLSNLAVAEPFPSAHGKHGCHSQSLGKCGIQPIVSNYAEEMLIPFSFHSLLLFRSLARLSQSDSLTISSLEHPFRAETQPDSHIVASHQYVRPDGSPPRTRKSLRLRPVPPPNLVVHLRRPRSASPLAASTTYTATSGRTR